MHNLGTTLLRLKRTFGITVRRAGLIGRASADPFRVRPIREDANAEKRADCGAPAAQTTRVHGYRGAHAGPGHRRHGGCFQPDSRRPADTAAVSGARAARARALDTDRRAALRPARLGDGAVGGMAEAVNGIRLARGVLVDVQFSGRIRRQRIGRRTDRDAGLLPRHRRPAAPGPCVRRIGPGGQRPSTRHRPRLRAVATQVQRRSEHRRENVSHEPAGHASHDRRRHAARDSLPSSAGGRAGAELQRQRRRGLSDAVRPESGGAAATILEHRRSSEARRHA